jgi:hypothetical protein
VKARVRGLGEEHPAAWELLACESAVRGDTSCIVMRPGCPLAGSALVLRAAGCAASVIRRGASGGQDNARPPRSGRDTR